MTFIGPTMLNATALIERATFAANTAGAGGAPTWSTIASAVSCRMVPIKAEHQLLFGGHTGVAVYRCFFEGVQDVRLRDRVTVTLAADQPWPSGTIFDVISPLMACGGSNKASYVLLREFRQN